MRKFATFLLFLIMVITMMLLMSMHSVAQPGDPTGDPDSISSPKLPTDPSVDPDKIVFRELVCDSVSTVNQRGKIYIILFYRNKRIAVYRKEERTNSGKKTGYSFY